MLSHCIFPYAFHWKENLACLYGSDRAIFLTYHYIIILIIGFMAYMLLIQPRTLLNSPLRYAILGFFILFYIIRIITEFTLFGYTMPQSPVIIILCIIPVILWLVTLFNKNTTE
jgi:hypothetical protein